jgi:hypothetical protein
MGRSGHWPKTLPVRIDNLTLPDRIDRTVKLGVIGKLGLIGLVGWLWGADAGYELHHQARATRTLDGTLRDLFTNWYPAMPANDGQALPLVAAA